MNLKTNLKPWQEEAVEKLSKLKVGALYMDMGTGKTRTALELIDKREREEKINKVIWLCPCSVVKTLENELTKHCRTWRHLIEICGIETLSSSIRANIKLYKIASPNTYLVVDESSLVKNSKALRSQNIERLALKCKYKLILNGTPLSKNEKDLYQQWRILDWRILGYSSFWSFAANHIEYDSKGRIRRCLNLDYLTEKIAPYTFQVKREDCVKLPPKKYKRVVYTMSKDQEEHYLEVLDRFLKQVDEYLPSTLYKLFNALQLVSSGVKVLSLPNEKMNNKRFFKRPLDNPRIQTLIKIIKENEKSEKYIIFCKYTNDIFDISLSLKEKFGKDSTVLFYGGLPQSQRQNNIMRFKNDANFFIANKLCAGYGLNLQFCANVIFYTNDWDFATRLQAEDRVHRLGQERTVNIFDICADKTIDIRILNCLLRKERLIDTFRKKIDKLQSKKEIKRWLYAKNLSG